MSVIVSDTCFKLLRPPFPKLSFSGKSRISTAGKVVAFSHELLKVTFIIAGPELKKLLLLLKKVFVLRKY